jgi:hypothetical protein
MRPMETANDRGRGCLFAARSRLRPLGEQRRGRRPSRVLGPASVSVLGTMRRGTPWLGSSRGREAESSQSLPPFLVEGTACLGRGAHSAVPIEKKEKGRGVAANPRRTSPLECTTLRRRASPASSPSPEGFAAYAAPRVVGDLRCSQPTSSPQPRHGWGQDRTRGEG